MVAVTESKLYFYINKTKKTFTSYRKQIKQQQKRTRLTKTYKLKQMQSIKRNHHKHIRSKSPKNNTHFDILYIQSILGEKGKFNKR